MVENRKDKGAWWATVHRVAQSQTQLKRLSTHSRFTAHTLSRQGLGPPDMAFWCPAAKTLCRFFPGPPRLLFTGRDPSSFEQPSAQPSRGIFCAAAPACCGESGFLPFSFSLSLVLVLPGLCCAILAKSLFLFRI